MLLFGGDPPQERRVAMKRGHVAWRHSGRCLEVHFALKANHLSVTVHDCLKALIATLRIKE